MTSPRLEVVVAGGGIAGLEALLALRELAGDRVSLTLVEPRGALALRAASRRSRPTAPPGKIVARRLGALLAERDRPAGVAVGHPDP